MPSTKWHLHGAGEFGRQQVWLAGHGRLHAERCAWEQGETDDNPAACCNYTPTQGTLVRRLMHPCRGDGEQGQLGTGKKGRVSTYEDYSSTIPVTVAGDIPFYTISAGAAHTCGISPKAATAASPSPPAVVQPVSPVPGSPAPPSPAPSTSTSSSSVPIGAIVGGVVGGLAGECLRACCFPCQS